MSDQTFKLSFSRAVRLFVTVIMAAIFGGFVFHSSMTKAADNDITYVFQSTDNYGNPIESPTNNQTMTAAPGANFLDASAVIPETLSNGRYRIAGYYTDNDFYGQYNYHEFWYGDNQAKDELKKINIHYPERKANKQTVKVTFVYQDNQSTRPRAMTLPEGALEREDGKLKTFYADINGKELAPSITYDYEKVPEYYDGFKSKINGYRYVAMVVRNPKPYGSYSYSDSKVFANLRVSNITDLLAQYVLPPNYMLGLAKRMRQFDPGSTATYIYEKYAANLTIDYLDESGNPIDGYPAQNKQLDLNSEYSEEAPDIPGYTLVGDKKVTGKVTDDFKITFKYKKTIVPPTPYDKGDKSNNHGNSNDNNADFNNNKKDSTPVTPTFPDRKTLPDGTQLPNYAATEGTAVYATKKIYMYQHANFKKGDRIATYPKAKRISRPMFVVTDYARSNGGALRYKVKDVNHHSKTSGKVGYITANKKFVVKVYYSTMPKNKQITVISKKGVNVYKHANLTKRVKNYKKGSHLKVKKIVKHNLTTRYQLSNGDYITANKKLVIHGNY